MLLGMCEGGDAPLVYGGKVGKKHVYAAGPAIGFLGGTLCVGEVVGGVGPCLILCTIVGGYRVYC